MAYHGVSPPVDISMPTARDVPADLLIKKVAEHLRRLPQISSPPWAAYAKMGSHRERLPHDKDWWYTRCASLLRKVYMHGPIGLTDLRSAYGGGTSVGYSPTHHRDAGGSAIRKALQQLEAAGLVAKQSGKGRVVTSRGASLLDRHANEIFEELAKTMPALARYS